MKCIPLILTASLCFAASALGQQQVAPKDTDARLTSQQVGSVGAFTDPKVIVCPWGGGVLKTGPAVPVQDPTGKPGGSPEAGPRSQIDFQYHDNHFRISGGGVGDPVGILVGFDPAHIQLPGTAVLRLMPVATLVVGAFNNNGEFFFALPRLDPFVGSPVPFLSQALTALAGRDDFASSAVLQLEFRPDGTVVLL